MSKLYQLSEDTTFFMSTENFCNYFQSAKVISTEAVSDYLYKIKDSLISVSSMFFSQTSDLTTEDLLRNRHEVNHVIKRLKYVTLIDKAVDKPENFKGRYLDYLALLNDEGDRQFINTNQAISTLNLSIAAFINDYREDGVMTLYGNSKFKDTAKLTEKIRDEVKKYFPKNDKSTRTRFGDVVASLGEIDTLYQNLITNDNILNIKRVNEIRKLAETAIGLLDTLIEQNGKSNLFAKNEAVKKDLIFAIQVTAEAVETFGYLYSNAIALRTAFKSTTEMLLASGNTEG